MSCEPIKPSVPFGGLAFIAWCLMVAALVGCSTVREDRSVTKEQATLRIPQVTIETIAGPITVKPVEIQQQRASTTESHGETEIAPPQIPPAVAEVGGSLLSLIPGAGGLLAAIFAFVSRQKAMGTLSSVVKGLDEFKADAANPDTVTKLEDTLSRKMDVAHKKLVRKLRG